MEEMISIVIPAYNEEKIIVENVSEINAFFAKNFRNYEIIVSDDGSRDNTKKLLEEMNLENLRVVSHFPNMGKGAAVREGILAACGDIIVSTDADLAYGLDVIPQMLEKLIKNDGEFCLGSRKLHKEGYADYPFIRLLTSRVFSTITAILAGFKFDTQCGMKCFKRQAAHEIFSMMTTNGFAYDFECVMLAKKKGKKILEFPVKIINHRESKVNVILDSYRIFRDVLKIRHSVKVRLNGEK